jgi:hypothetical protein
MLLCLLDDPVEKGPVLGFAAFAHEVLSEMPVRAVKYSH